MTVTPSDLDYLASLYAAAAATDSHEQALQRFTAITETDETACDAWVGRISRGDLQRSTLFRAWYSRRNFGRLASAADLSVVSLNAWVPIGANFVNLRAPVTTPAALTVGYAISEATNAASYAEALEALNETEPNDLTTWARAVIYATGTRWDKAIETLNEHLWKEPIFAECADLIHGAAAAHLGLYVEAERRLTAALTGSQSQIPCAEHGAWYLAMVYRAVGREDEAIAKLQWLHATYPSAKVTEALQDHTIRLPVTTRERIADRTDPWQDETTGDAGAPVIRKELLEEASAKLNKQIGLEAVKEQIADYRASVQMAVVRAAKGLKSNQGSHHMIFVGPPGTGKTTIADIVALNLAGLGVIAKHKVVTANGRADLCAEYEGQSAPKTSRLIDSALGGVLFIDEFYTLAQERDGRSDPFGQEALDTLLARMENDRHQLVVIIAGYPTDIDRTLNKNEGLRTRFNTRIEFTTYSPQEIVAIANVMAADNDSLIDTAANAEFLAAVEDLVTQVFKDKNGHDKNGLDHAGNGRYARNVIEAAERARNRRLVELPNYDELSADELQIITVTDMRAGLQKVHARL